MATKEETTQTADSPHYCEVISRVDIRKVIILALAQAAKNKKKP